METPAITSLSINYPILILSLAVLFVPRIWESRGKRFSSNNRRSDFTSPRDFREPGDRSLRLREEFSKPRNYIDLFRGLAGSYGIMSYSFLQAGDKTPNLLYFQIAVLAASVLFQMPRYDGKIRLAAPTFFLCGLSAGICGFDVAVYGACIAWLFSSILPTPTAFLILQALCIGAFGFVLKGPFSLMVILASIINVMPAILSLMLNRPLSIASKARRV